MIRTTALLLLLLASGLAGQVGVTPGPAVAERVKPATDVVPTPALEDFQLLQKRVAAVSKIAVATTVALRIPSEDGGVASGVIVSADGIVLTAGHCVPDRGAKVEVILSDGRKVDAVALGKNGLADSGMLRITSQGKWPFAKMGRSSGLERNQVCLGTGHPGGRERGRSALVRLGVIRDVATRWRSFLRTTCLITPGDSGGPLFDLEGQVIGIHSYITPALRSNYQVPIDAYRRDWERLASGEQWNVDVESPDFNGAPARPVIGVTLDRDADGCVVSVVREGLPAEKAGLLEGDVILEIDEEAVANRRALGRVMRDKEPGDRVTLRVRRGDRDFDVSLVLARR